MQHKLSRWRGFATRDLQHKYLNNKLITMKTKTTKDNATLNNPAPTPNILTEGDNLKGGYYYTKEGEYLGNEGSSQNVFIATKVIKDIKDKTGKVTGKKITFTKKKQLNINHADFTYCAGVILTEGNEYEEMLFIAHTTNNEAKFNNKTMKYELSSSYSSTPTANKKPILDKLDEQAKTKSEIQLLAKEKNARKAIIDVYLGGVDVSNGSQRWDGADFLAWGLSHSPFKSTNNRHAKFAQFGTIKISKLLFDTFKNNIGSSISYASRKWENPKVKGSFSYAVPEAVFLDSNNWINNTFIYSTKVNKLTLEATAVRHQTIYWKIVR